MELFGVNIGLNSNSFLFWGGAIFTLGNIFKSANIAKYGGYGVMIGVIWYFVSNVIGIF